MPCVDWMGKLYHNKGHITDKMAVHRSYRITANALKGEHEVRRVGLLVDNMSTTLTTIIHRQ